MIFGLKHYLEVNLHFLHSKKLVFLVSTIILIKITLKSFFGRKIVNFKVTKDFKTLSIQKL